MATHSCPNGSFPFSTKKMRCTSAYGPRSFTLNGAPYSDNHRGCDLVPISEPKYDIGIYAVASGILVESEWTSKSVSSDRWSYGNRVVIKVDTRFGTEYHLYAHMKNRINCPVGTVINQGQRIGTMGNTGNSGGAHLHFETRKGANTFEARSKDLYKSLGAPSALVYQDCYEIPDNAYDSSKFYVDSQYDFIGTEGTISAGSISSETSSGSSAGSSGSSSGSSGDPDFIPVVGSIPSQTLSNAYDKTKSVNGIATKAITLVDTSKKPTSIATSGTNLLSFPTFVETPFIIAEIGGYTFGDHSIANCDGIISTTFPNYMNSLEVVKINGAVNTYTLTMVYQVSSGDDPNLLDKIFGSVANDRTIKINYGDWSAPNFIYKEETGIITNVRSNIDFSGSKITYTISFVSDGYQLKGNKQSFPKCTNVRPSTKIIEVLYNNNYKLLDIFKGMKDKNTILSKGFIPTNDRPVTIEAKNSIDPLAYINYLVSCMVSQTSPESANLGNSTYFLTVCDDVYDEFGGTYFKITEAPNLNSSIDINSSDIFFLDVGYPGDNFVTQFSLKNDEEWGILYDYSDKIKNYNKIYRIDNKGNLITEDSPNILTTGENREVKEINRNWWTKVTQFPIEGTVTLKGLLRPAMLMTYVKINSYFYGQKHISSGLYIITKQVDRINASGYTTTLTLLRIDGDI